MKTIYLITYISYILLFLDSLQKTPIIGVPFALLDLLFAIMLIFEQLYIRRDQNGITVKKKSIYFTMAIIFGAVSFLVRDLVDIRELERMIVFLFLIIINAKMVNEFECYEDFITISFFAVFAHFVFVSIKNGINIINEFPHIFDFQFESALIRYRVDFGFYHVNGAGNILGCAGCLALMMLYMFMQKKRRHSFMAILLWGVGTVFLTVALLLTNSRNPILTVLICGITLLYFAITDSQIVLRLKRLLQFFMIATGVTTVILYVLPTIMVMYEESSRRLFYRINLRLIDTPWKSIFGIGLINPGSFGSGGVLNYKSAALDNYYIYIYVCGGLLLLAGLISMISVIGIKLVKNRKQCPSTVPVIACFVALLCSGFGETCVLYHLFPSCILFWTIIISTVYTMNQYSTANDYSINDTDSSIGGQTDGYQDIS